MARPRFFKDKEKRKRFVHIMAAFVILIHAFGHHEEGHESFIYFTIAGTVFLLIALLHPLIEKRAPWIDGVFFIIEGLLSLVVAYDFFHMGKKALPFVYLFLALFQFFMAFKMSRKGIRQHKLNH